MAANDVSEDIRELRQMMQENLQMTTAVHTVLFPAPGQPNSIQALSKRVSRLENWRSMLGGAWAVVTGIFAWHMAGKH